MLVMSNNLTTNMEKLCKLTVLKYLSNTAMKAHNMHTR